MTREKKIDCLCRLRSYISVRPSSFNPDDAFNFIEALSDEIKALQTEPSVTAEKTEKGEWPDGKLFMLRLELTNGKAFLYKVTKVTNDNTIVGALLENGEAIYFPLANLNYWGVSEIEEDEE